MIMDYVDGVFLSDILEIQADGEMDHTLNPDIDNAMLNGIYRQIAGYLLQLSQLTFFRIGAISVRQDSPTGWSVTRRPLTYNMNELASVNTYHSDQFPTMPFDNTGDYFRSLAAGHRTHL